MPESTSGANSTGIWFNKQSVRFLELSFPHTQQPASSGGLRFEALGPGKVVVWFLDGKKEELRVVNGDALVSNDQEMYLSIQTPREG